MGRFSLQPRTWRRGTKFDDPSGCLATVLTSNSAASEAYRTLRTNLLYYAHGDAPPKVIVVTSHGPREGKSVTCANLGVVLAEAGKSTLLLDCDLHTPTLHKIFALPNLRGVTDVLAGEYSLQGIWQEPLPELKVVTVGPVPPNPAELLASRRFAELLDQSRQEFEYVLVDSPPVGRVSDPLVLAAKGDGVLLVIDAQSTRKASVWQSMRALEGVGARVLGTIMNNVNNVKGGYGNYPA